MNPFLSRQVEKSILRVFEDLASPGSVKAAILLRSGDWDQLASCKIDPANYIEAESYWRDATALNLLRKCVDLPTTFDRKAVAEEAFLTCEASCLRANIRLEPYLHRNLDVDEGVSSFIGKARKILRRILGPCPDNVQGRFGPGATHGDRGRLTTIPDKMSSQPTLTPDAWSFHFPWSGTAWATACASSGKEVTFIPGNRFTTVPKDCEKDRGIAIEPSINVFFQLGYGREIRKRLSRFGINLTEGQDIHRQVAREASIRGHLATLDLSNASDTICRNLVKLLLPRDWFSVLDDLRSKKTNFRGSWHLLEKFSSMGNGFTFELETLIFLGLCLALEREDLPLIPGVNIFVYGDDIIVPSELSNDVMSMLGFFGMATNKRKTFVDGPFRESCGGDYFNGVDVRPHFLKESPNEPQQLISLANGLRRISKGAPGRSSCIIRGWLGILDALPNTIRQCRGPESLGDLLVHDDKERWQFRWRSSIRYFKVYRPARYRKVSWRYFRPEVILASALYGVPSGTQNGPVGSRNGPGGIIPRNSVAGYKLGWVPLS